MKRKILSLACALCLGVSLAGFAGAAAEHSYTDVPENAWYAEAVRDVSDRGLMTGTTETAFHPNGAVTRATVVAVLWRLEGSPDAWVESMFPDVAEDDWYYTAAAWAKGKGIAAGYGNGDFGPDDKVTREQLAMFLYRYAQYAGEPVAEGVLGLYSDADKVSKWAQDGMRHALGAGLITGTSQGTLNPGGVASRAELAAILVRLTTPVAG